MQRLYKREAKYLKTRNKRGRPQFARRALRHAKLTIKYSCNAEALDLFCKKLPVWRLVWDTLDNSYSLVDYLKKNPILNQL
jgi:hypothetical protein